MSEGDRKEQYFWTLPFGARTEEGNVANSPFFPGRHTYQLSTPGINGELSWLIVKATEGLLYPKLTNKETIILEQGVFEEGKTPVLIKPPDRNFTLDVIIRGSNRPEYRRNLLHLAYIMSYEHNTVSPPPGFEEVNQLFDITDNWGRPNPFTFTERVPLNDDGTYDEFHVDCLVQTIDPQPSNEAPDGVSADVAIKLKAPKPSIYGKEIATGDLFGLYDDATVALPEIPPTTFLDSTVLRSIKYSSGIFASARSGFFVSMPLTIAGGATLYSFGILETGSGKFARFMHQDYPGFGWTLLAGVGVGDPVLEFDSVNSSFIARYGTLPDIVLESQKAARSEWTKFKFAPGGVYRFFLELDDGSGTPTSIVSSVKYAPRWVGM